MEKKNAPSDWTPAGAAHETRPDCSAIAEDLRFALKAMGIREEFGPVNWPAAMGWGLALWGMALLLALVGA